ncbi:MAG: response regulator transcription factor [Chloroflexota bacterium]|nr:response regulator transcription factor [Chloroflexota bacterium]
MEPIKVLIVDDNPTFIGIVRRFLSRFADIEVVAEATSAEDALDLVQEVSPQVALVDIAMPEVNGLALTRLLREKHPTLVVILVTLLDTTQYRSASAEAGADGFVAKPTLSTDLVPLIRRYASKAENLAYA